MLALPERPADRSRASRVLIKDNIDTREQPATVGSPALLRATAADAFLICRLREAGAVILGKANLSEWANFRSTSSSSGWSTLGGQAVNPWGEGRNPSGSSSGSAVAVAAGLAPAAIGTGTDGSIVVNSGHRYSQVGTGRLLGCGPSHSPSAACSAQSE